MNILRLTIPVVFLSWVNLAARAESGSTTLEAEIRRIANAAGGEVGVAAWCLDGSGPRMLLNADEAFPMASTFKVAVAGALLGKVDAGTLSLETMLPVDKSRYVESEVIADTLIHSGVNLSIHKLLEVMLTSIDNTATDVLTNAAGGPTAVTAWLRAEGIAGLRVD